MAQSTILADTGNLATVTFAAGITGTVKIRRVVPPSEAVEKIECSHLGTTTYKQYVKSDLIDLPELEIEFLWDTFLVAPTPGLDLGLVTITYPMRTGETTPATRAGTAYVSGITHPTLANGELQLGTLKIQYDVATPPAYTKST